MIGAIQENGEGSDGEEAYERQKTGLVRGLF